MNNNLVSGCLILTEKMKLIRSFQNIIHFSKSQQFLCLTLNVNISKK